LVHISKPGPSNRRPGLFQSRNRLLAGHRDAQRPAVQHCHDVEQRGAASTASWVDVASMRILGNTVRNKAGLYGM
jgi:hypothetical protein